MGLISAPIKLPSDTGILFILSLLKNREPVSFMASFKLKPQYFTPQEYALIEIINKHVEANRSIPDKSFVELTAGVKFPPDLPTEEPLKFWAKEVIKRYTVETSYALTVEATQQISLGNLEGAYDLLAEATKVTAEGAGKSKVFHLDNNLPEVIDASINATLNIRNFGVPFGFNFLDEQSGGAQPGDLITLAGSPGSSKTFTLQHMALAAYDSGLSVLFVPTEMSALQYNRRFVALRNNLNINDIKFGKLSTTIGIELIKYDIELMKKRENKFYIADASFSISVLDVKAAVYENKPDAVYIDGAYLLRPEGFTKSKYEMVSSVAESLKILAIEMNIPIFVTYQLNKRTDEIYQSAVVRQLSSIVIEMSDHKIDDSIESWDRRENLIRYKKMKITKGRDGESGEMIFQLDTEHTRLIEPDPEREGRVDVLND